ncbi:MAG: ATP synthase subunit I [Legionellaceae bacterium]|nr:ATP synthase subunit I [Legionellaceae bacterium]
MKNQQGLQGAKRLFLMQLRVGACVSLMIWTMFGLSSARSILLGSLVSLVPQAWFARVIFREQRARFSQQILKSAYRGEAMKLLMSAALFAVVFRWVDVVPVMFFAGYFMVHVTFWFAPWFFRGHQDSMGKASVE